MKDDDSEPEQTRVYLDPTLSPLDAEILKDLHFWKRRTIADLVRGHNLRRSSRNTIKLHLQKLLRAGLARKHGKGRATWYTL